MWTVTNISFTGGTVELIPLYSATMHPWHGRELKAGTPLMKGAEIEGIHSSNGLHGKVFAIITDNA